MFVLCACLSSQSLASVFEDKAPVTAAWLQAGWLRPRLSDRVLGRVKDDFRKTRRKRRDPVKGRRGVRSVPKKQVRFAADAEASCPSGVGDCGDASGPEDCR